ncbi:MAG: DHH family phosphoesterase [Methanobrevibacter sp.]|nr:DHH family phosphoesterase [Methanobrevibacter sp.]
MILFQTQRRIKRKTLSDLTDSEKGKLYNALNRMIINEVPPKYYEHISKILIGDSYTFLLEDPASFLRDGSEFSTAMNACGRNHEEKIAMEVLKGNRDWALVELEEISRKHRYNLATSMEKVANGEIVELENLQYFDGTGIKPEIVGTITGMILGYCNWQKPIIGFTQIEDSDGIKVSLRCSRFLSYDGIHFGNIIRQVAQDVGGSGGGHAMACGAYIPLSKKSEFLEKFNQVLFTKIS